MCTVPTVPCVPYRTVPCFKIGEMVPYQNSSRNSAAILVRYHFSYLKTWYGTVHMVRLVRYTWYGWYGTLVQPVQSVQFIGTISLRTIHGRDVWHVLYHVPYAAIIYLYCTVPYHTYVPWPHPACRTTYRTMYHDSATILHRTLTLRAVPHHIYTKTPNGRYFYFRHLMKILVLIWAYHRT